MFTRIASVTLATLALSACANSPFGVYKTPDREAYDETGKMQTVTKAKSFETGIIKAFPDIPIPSSHKIDLERTVIFTSPTQTVGKVTLTGKGDVDSIYRYFEAQMVNNGWNLVNAFQSATSSMYFAKPGRFVAIIIEGTAQNSTVFLNIGPE